MSSSFLNNNSNSLSISVPDDDDCEERNRLRAQVRRKRKKKPVHRVGNEWTRRVVKFSVRYWVVLIFLGAAGLLFFETMRIGRKPSRVAETGHKEKVKLNKHSPNGKSEGNLNRLDPVTRIIGGVRQPVLACLKLLPPEDLEQLDVPLRQSPGSPVKNLVYITDSAKAYINDWTSLSQDGARFNLFTGNQSMEERERSFEVNETMAVHCGFYNENGGFKISNEDKNFMRKCKVVVSTCAFGGGDDLYQPIGMSEASIRKVCYVAFWDEITLAAQESEGRKIDENGYVGRWRIVIVKDLPFSDQRLNGKIPKADLDTCNQMLPHRLFPNSKYSIWVDSKSQFRRDPLGVLEALLWRTNSVLAISEHGARSSVYDEAKAVVKKHKATPEDVELQLNQYRHDNLPEDKRFNGKKALAEASVIVREHTPLTNLFMCLWFNEVVRFTSRDQLSFPYVLWRLKVVKDINMFPVCIRKDLINSMGHRRKAKSLQI